MYIQSERGSFLSPSKGRSPRGALQAVLQPYGASDQGKAEKGKNELRSLHVGPKGEALLAS